VISSQILNSRVIDRKRNGPAQTQVATSKRNLDKTYCVCADHYTMEPLGWYYNPKHADETSYEKVYGLSRYDLRWITQTIVQAIRRVDGSSYNLVRILGRLWAARD